jgi:hypothetical protein
MKPRLTQVWLIVALAAASLLSWSVYAQEKKSGPVVWEYNIHTTLNGDNNYQLSQLGAQGWELVSVRSDEEMMNNTRIIKVHYYLKRVKP